ncbi:MAG: 4Fe-4S dicluster domain-containing protein [Candidatus Izemoplasmataceae bacterium]
MITVNKSYLQPKRVAIDLGTLDEDLLLKNIHDEVTIGEPLLKEVTHEPFSPLSGKVMQIITKQDENNQDTLSLIIENDFKNTVYKPLVKKPIDELIVTYFKPTSDLERLNYKKNMPLIVNLVHENEPFVSLDPKMIDEMKDDLLSTLASMHSMWQYREIIILTKEGIRTKWFSSMNLPITVKKIKLEKHIDAVYKIINKTFNNALYHKKTYNYLTLNSIIKLTDMITHHRPSILTQLTISGDAINNPMVLSVRIGTLFSELIRVFNGFKNHETITLHKNRIIENNVILHEQFSITETLSSIHAQAYKEREVYDCIKCGSCNDICPVGILPSKIMHSLNQGIALDYMKSNVCIECGLCAYICPSKIPVMHYVKEAKKILKGDQS